jgi:hypothetical protein
MVKSNATQRRGYEQLFPNKVAQAHAKAQGITRKNYQKRLMTFDPVTGGDAKFQSWVPETRIKNMSKCNVKLVEKMKSHRVSLTEACNFFLFEYCWKAVSAAMSSLVGSDNWKLAIPKLLQLYVQAKKRTLRAIIIVYLNFNDQEKAYFAQFANINDFLHGRGQIIDTVWSRLVIELFEGQTKAIEGL